MSRVLALDIGTVRIGAAISDINQIIAQPLGVWKAENDEWLIDFDDALRNYEVNNIVVGLPVRTDGKKSEAGERIKNIVDELRKKYPEKKFIFFDERFTTVIAQNLMIEADISRKKRKKNVDKLAASIILEGYLESKRG